MSNANKHELTPETIWKLAHEPMLRWNDVPGGNLLAEQLTVQPDPYLTEVFELTLREQQRKALATRDPLYANTPPINTLSTARPGQIPLAALETGDTLAMPIKDVTRNVLVVGPTGGGKTNFLRVLILAVLEA